jgi:hypothetical protein
MQTMPSHYLFGRSEVGKNTSPLCRSSVVALPVLSVRSSAAAGKMSGAGKFHSSVRSLAGQEKTGSFPSHACPHAECC